MDLGVLIGRVRGRQEVLPAGPLVIGQEPLDLGAEGGVATTQLIEQGCTPSRVTLS
jgi:hypothetical protein